MRVHVRANVRERVCDGSLLPSTHECPFSLDANVICRRTHVLAHALTHTIPVASLDTYFAKLSIFLFSESGSITVSVITILRMHTINVRRASTHTHTKEGTQQDHEETQKMHPLVQHNAQMHDPVPSDRRQCAERSTTFDV